MHAPWNLTNGVQFKERFLYVGYMAWIVAGGSDRTQLRPSELNSFVHDHLLEAGQSIRIVSHICRQNIMVQTVADTISGCFADIPFYRMQSVAAVRNMGDANVFAGRQDILHPFRN